MRILLFLLALLPGLAAAQDLSGTYAMPGDEGAVTLEFRQSGAQLAGSLAGGGVQFELVGEIDGQGAYGLVYADAGELYFEAELHGDTLHLILAEIDPFTGSPDPAQASQFILTRSRPAAPFAGSPPGAAPASPSGSNSAGAPDTGGEPSGAATPGTPGAPLGGSAQDLSGEPAQVGRRYEAGTRISAPWTGVSFTVPAHYYAGYAPEQDAFLMVSDTRPGLVVIEAYSHLPVENAVQELSRAVEASGGVRLLPQGAPEVNGDTLRATFQAITAQDSGVLQVIGRSSEHGNVLLAAALGATHEGQELQALLDGLVASASFSRPDTAAAERWRQELAGSLLSISSSTADTGYNDSIFESSRTTLELCSDGAYTYRYSYQFSANVPGMGATNSDGDEDSGRWQVEFGLLGPVLALDSSADGGRTLVSLLESGGSLYVDGRAVNRGRSESCH